MSIEIRNMKTSQIPEAGAVFMESFNSTGESWNLENSIKHIEFYFTEDSSWVAMENKKIVGILVGKPLAFEKGDSFYIDAIAVLPKYQKSGIGKLLWERAEKYIKENNIGSINLDANPSWKSYEWYKKMGLIESGWINLYKNY